MTASLPSAPAICTARELTVMAWLSTSHTLLRPCSSRKADSGSLVTPGVCGSSTCTAAVCPRRMPLAAALPMSALTRKVRVTGSAAAEISRIVAGSGSPVAPHRRTLKCPGFVASALINPTLSSGTANTTSRGPSCARRSTGVPAAATMPGSSSTAVTTPLASASRVE